MFGSAKALRKAAPASFTPPLRPLNGSCPVNAETESRPTACNSARVSIRPYPRSLLRRHVRRRAGDRRHHRYSGELAQRAGDAGKSVIVTRRRLEMGTLSGFDLVNSPLRRVQRAARSERICAAMTAPAESAADRRREARNGQNRVSSWPSMYSMVKNSSVVPGRCRRCGRHWDGRRGAPTDRLRKRAGLPAAPGTFVPERFDRDDFLPARCRRPGIRNRRNRRRLGSAAHSGRRWEP